MKAAVLHALGQPPRFEDFADPEAIEGEVLVRVTGGLAEERRQDDGKRLALRPPPPHLPCVCGIDGVGLLMTELGCTAAGPDRLPWDDGRAGRCRPSVVSAGS